MSSESLTSYTSGGAHWQGVRGANGCNELDRCWGLPMSLIMAIIFEYLEKLRYLLDVDVFE